jgi:hypothetical protein
MRLSERSLYGRAVFIGIAMKSCRRQNSVFDGWVYFGNAGGFGAGVLISLFLDSSAAKEGADLTGFEFVREAPEVGELLAFSGAVLWVVGVELSAAFFGFWLLVGEEKIAGFSCSSSFQREVPIRHPVPLITATPPPGKLAVRR